MQAKRNKEFIHYFPSAGRCSDISSKAGLQHTERLLGKTDTNTLKIPSFPQLYIAEHDVMWHGISLWSIGVSCPSRVPSQLLGHPQPAPWWGGVRGRECAELCISTAQQ